MDQRIVAHLWFSENAEEAVKFYIGLVNDSRIIFTKKIQGTPYGTVDLVDFQLGGMRFKALSSEGDFKFNQSTSIMLYSSSKEEIIKLWDTFSLGGKVLMDLERYAFNALYGWIEDKYGLSWQLILVDEAPVQRIMPSMMFTGKVCGKAEEAINYYMEIFKNSKIDRINHYDDSEDIVKEAEISYAEVNLDGVDLVALDNGLCDDFNFNRAFSLVVMCEDQDEIDYYWDKLSEDPKKGHSGWTKDKFGFSWQILPLRLNEMINKGNKEQIEKIKEAILRMDKFDIKVLEEAYYGKNWNE